MQARVSIGPLVSSLIHIHVSGTVVLCWLYISKYNTKYTLYNTKYTLYNTKYTLCTHHTYTSLPLKQDGLQFLPWTAVTEMSMPSVFI